MRYFFIQKRKITDEPRRDIAFDFAGDRGNHTPLCCNAAFADNHHGSTADSAGIGGCKNFNGSVFIRSILVILICQKLIF